MNNLTPFSRFSYSTRLALLLGLALAMAGCSQDEQTDAAATGSEQRATLITTTNAMLADVEVIEASIGYLETKAAPAVSAEVGGKIVSVEVDVGQTVSRGQVLARIEERDFKLEQDAAQSEVKRVEALIRSQQKQVARYEDMVKENFVTESVLDEAHAQLDALKEQLAGAKARFETAQRNLNKVQITSPTSGQIEKRLISQGDFVKSGTPLFNITRSTMLQAHLPYPENIAARLKPGLTVRLKSPVAPNDVVENVIKEIRPTVGRANRALNIIVELDNPGKWIAGGSVQGEVIIGKRQQAVMVPEISIVRRPAGSVVYTIENGNAQQRVVTLGVHRNGLVEVLSGLSGNEIVAKDGAAYLTDGTPVKTSGGQ